MSRVHSRAAKLEAALRALISVRPSNWDDDEDPDQAAAWRAADQAVDDPSDSMAIVRADLLLQTDTELVQIRADAATILHDRHAGRE